MATDQEEFLTADTEIPGQRFCLLSFLSPEKVLAKKELFFFEMFLKNYEVEWKSKNLEKFLADQVMSFNKKLEEEANRLSSSDLSGASDLCLKSRIPVDTVLGSYQAFVKTNASELSKTKIKENYEDFMFVNSKKLEDEYYAKNEFQTTVRGLKLRGVYGSQEEATARAKRLQRQDPIHNIYVAEVGKWLPWDPSPHEVQNQEYADEQLNMLMKGYKENEDARENFYSSNPDAKKAAFKKGVQSMVEPEAKAGTADDLSAAMRGVSSENAAIFDGPADLAIQRKMERAAAAAAAAAPAPDASTN